MVKIPESIVDLFNNWKSNNGRYLILQMDSNGNIILADSLDAPVKDALKDWDHFVASLKMDNSSWLIYNFKYGTNRDEIIQIDWIPADVDVKDKVYLILT